MKRPFLSKLSEIVRLKCPKCGKGDVFEKMNGKLISFPKMNASCSSCHYHYDREPGYFLGAMYASYGLAVLEGISTFLIISFLVPSLQALSLAFITAFVILLFAIWNYKLARVIWINIFPH